MAADGTIGLRARKKAQTRRALRDAAVRLVLERGMDKVTVEDIAQAADVSPRTFFNYFRTKEDAIVGIDPEEIAEISADLEARPATETPLEALGAVLLARASDLETRFEQWRMRTALVRSDPHLFAARLARFAEYERALAEVIARRTGLDVDVDAYPTTLVAATLAVLRSTLGRWRGTVGDGSLVAELTTALDWLARGFPPPEASPARVARPAGPTGVTDPAGTADQAGTANQADIANQTGVVNKTGIGEERGR